MNIVRSLLEYLNVYSLLDSVSGLAHAKKNQVKARFREEATAIVTKIIIVAVIGFTFIFFLLFASLTLSNYLNAVWDSRHLGYGLVALLYLLVVILLVLIKNISSLRNFLNRTAGKLFKNIR